jgi:hypothetical protein
VIRTPEIITASQSQVSAKNLPRERTGSSRHEHSPQWRIWRLRQTFSILDPDRIDRTQAERQPTSVCIMQTSKGKQGTPIKSGCYGWRRYFVN